MTMLILKIINAIISMILGKCRNCGGDLYSHINGRMYCEECGMEG